MKLKTLIIASILISVRALAQEQQVTFTHERINFSAAPRTTISPMSMKLWDNYLNGGPTDFGTVLEIYGFSSHQTSQLYFGGWDNSKIRYREAFYAQNAWSDWITLLDSKNDLASGGRLMLTGAGNHYIENGNFGIGTTTPNEKLAVNGKIRAREVKVEIANWPDYVFNDKYQLQTLEEIEAYIKANKRLPEMPSAKEVEANGIELGEMNKMLLKKQEELTLLLIEQNKQLQKLSSELKEIKDKFNNKKD